MRTAHLPDAKIVSVSVAGVLTYERAFSPNDCSEARSWLLRRFAESAAGEASLPDALEFAEHIKATHGIAVTVTDSGGITMPQADYKAPTAAGLASGVRSVAVDRATGGYSPDSPPKLAASTALPVLRKVDNVDPIVGVIRKRTASLAAPATSEASVFDRCRSRQAVEALRFGVVPASYVDALTVGLKKEREAVTTALEGAVSNGGESLAVVGDYGAGKTHLLDWTIEEALRRNFIVATASLDMHEVPPNDPHRIYHALVNSIRYPERSDQSSLGPLFDKLVQLPGIDKLVSSMSTDTHSNPLYVALGTYRRRHAEGRPVAKSLIVRWISSSRVMPGAISTATEGLVRTPLRKFTTVADLYCYLLSGVSWLAQKAGYSGLLVVLDESEHYGLLTTLQKLRADAFFQGMIYSALGSRQKRIPGCQPTHGPHCYLAHGGHDPVPFRYAPKTGLAFLFAVTPSPGVEVVRKWLEPARLLKLEQKLSLDDIVELITRIHSMHAVAYDVSRKVSIAEVLFELLRAYENGRVTLRGLVRHVTDTCDLLRAYENLTPQELQSEVVRAFA